MWRYAFKRMLVAIPMLLGIALLTFVLMRISPGNYLDTVRMDPQFSKETIARYEQLYGLDKPLFYQYVQWVRNLLRLELGYSFYYNVPVYKIIGERIWNTFVLSLAAFLLTWCVAIPLGIWAALNRNRVVDRAIQFFSYIALSLPSFFLGMILLFWASQTGMLPLGGMHSPDHESLGWLGRLVDLFKTSRDPHRGVIDRLDRGIAADHAR